MPLVVADPLGLPVDAECVGIDSDEMHLPRNCLQELLLALSFLASVVEGVLVLINFHDDNTVLSLHDKVYPDVAPGVPIEPDHDLTSKINALGL